MSPKRLLDVLGGFSEDCFLRFLANKASPSWVNELKVDGGVELDLDPVVKEPDLVESLKTLAFPANHIENLEDILSSVLIGYSLTLEEREAINEFKVIYAACLYLHCHANTAKTTGVANLACALIARRAVGLSKDERLQVLRFLLWIFEREERNGNHRSDFPKASILLCAHIVAADSEETLLEEANEMFRAELATVGPSPDKTAIKATLEQAARIDPNLDAKLVLEQIGGTSRSHETSIRIFRSVLDEANLDATKVAMLNPRQ